MFIFKEVNTSNRYCVSYIKRPKFECGHYFGSLNLQGACFSKSLKFPKNIKTILTEKEIKQLLDYNNKDDKLGYGIKAGSKRYKQGLKLLEEIEPIFKKLESKENLKLFDEIQKEEREYLYKEYQLTEQNVDIIFNQYYLEYRDRSCIGSIYNNKEEMGMKLIDYYYPNIENIKQYFDYEAFAEDLLNGENYLELDSGQCVSLNY